MRVWQRHYTGLTSSRLSTTYTFDAVIASQGTGGFKAGGPNGWDMSTSGFGESSDRAHYLWTGIANVTDLAAIRKWTPANPGQYNVMIVSFMTSPWVLDYTEVDPFDIWDVLGTIAVSGAPMYHTVVTMLPVCSASPISYRLSRSDLRRLCVTAIQGYWANTVLLFSLVSESQPGT